MQLLVLGMHRSGTSAVTGVLNMMGFHVGEPSEQHEATPDNPKGYFERIDVFDLHEVLLQAMGAAWYDPRQVDFDTLSPDDHESARQAAAGIVDGLDRHPRWVLKDPRMCLLLPLWLPLLTQPCCLFVSRDPRAIARSLKRRNGFPPALSLALWQSSMRIALDATKSVPRLFLQYEDLLAEPRDTVERLRVSLERIGGQGLEAPTIDQLGEFLDPGLVRSTEGDESAFREEDRELFEWLRSAARGEPLPEIRPVPEARPLDDDTVLELTSAIHSAVRADLGVLHSAYRDLEARYRLLEAELTKARQAGDD